MPELTVLFADSKGAADWEWIRALPAASQLRLIAPDDNREESLRDLLVQADVLVAQTRPISAELLHAAPRLKLIQCYGRRPVVDHAAARAAGVQVATMPLHGCIAVAELAITLLLALSKNLVQAHDATVSGAYRQLGVEPIKTEQRKHKFQWMNMQPQMLEVVGRTLGIIGYGEIGSETARRAQALGMQVLYNKRTRATQ
jgi:phosphoglycerate dehydrogenase-like enzyme